MRIFAILWFLIVLGTPLAAGEKEDVQAIINGQIEAFQQDDFAAALPLPARRSARCSARPKTLARWCSAAILWSGDRKTSAFSILKAHPMGLSNRFKLSINRAKCIICGIF